MSYTSIAYAKANFEHVCKQLARAEKALSKIFKDPQFEIHMKVKKKKKEKKLHFVWNRKY